MQYTDFKGKKISRLGFGLMRLPVDNDDQSQINYDKTEEMVLAAIEGGVNYFDTAYAYHNGYSEKVFGKILTNNHLHGKVNTATKLFTMLMNRPDFDPRRLFDEQMERLQTDHLEFYLIHGVQWEKWQTLRDKFNIVPFLNSLKEQGIVDHVGFSFHDSYESFCHLLDDYDFDFGQIQYNYLDHELQAGDAGIAYAIKKGVPLNIMEPVKGGSLIFPDYPEVEAIKARHGLADMPNADLAFAYVYDKEGLLSVLSGMSTIEQVKDNLRIADECRIGMVTPEMNACCEEIRQYLESLQGIPCTACRYCCEGCPEKIDIPMAFQCYNEGNRFRNPASQKRNFDRSCSNIADCVECGQCSDICPQHLDVPELLKKVRAFMAPVCDC